MLPIYQILILRCTVLHHRELKREKAWSRIHLIPMILAEADRDTFRREQANLKREQEIMKDVPNWEVSNGIEHSLS